MIGRRAVIGLTLLCALAFSAIVVTSAMAETKTTTAFTCVKKAKKGGVGFSKEHCAEADKVSTEAEFEHVEIKPGEWTKIHLTNEGTLNNTTEHTPSILKATIGGLKATITCTKATGTNGEIENFEDPVTKAMDIKVRNLEIHYTECVLSGALKTIEECEVEKNTVTTNKLEGTSVVNTHEIRFTGPGGGAFAHIPLEKCKTASLNLGVEVTGSANAIGDGATLETTAATTEPTLIVAGQKASYTSKATVRMINSEGKLENPISATTVVDP